MKVKTILFFVFGLIGWLFATNYQVVYSKIHDFINPQSENIEVIAEESIAINEPEVVLSEESVIEEDVIEEKESTLVADQASEINPIKKVEAITEITNDEIIDNTSNTEDAQIANLENNNQSETSSSTSVLDSDTPNSTVNSISTYNEMQSAHSNLGFPMMNPNMMNPGMYMNPMIQMTPMMMSMMGQMMNPGMYMNPMTMMNYPVNTMTHSQNMNAMMMSMDPKMMFGMFGQPSKEYLEGEVPDQLPVVTIPGMPTQTYQNWPKNKVSPSVSREAKHNAFQTAMAMSPLSMRSMVSMMADKIPVDEGVTWDDAVEAMKLRANEVNFKFVGSSPLWKQIEAETEQPSAKVEMFRFCDARMARKILDEVPEFIVFLPCKIALLEDAEGKLWVMTLDWDVSWMDYAQNPNNHLSKDIREHAKMIRENIQYIMEGAATGDF